MTSFKPGRPDGWATTPEAASGVPLTVLDLHDQALEEIYGASLLLVRPDHHVAWRGTSMDRPTTEAILDQIRGI